MVPLKQQGNENRTQVGISHATTNLRLSKDEVWLLIWRQMILLRKPVQLPPCLSNNQKLTICHVSERLLQLLYAPPHIFGRRGDVTHGDYQFWQGSSRLLVAMPPDQTCFFGHYNLWTLLFSVFSSQAFYTVINIVERYFLKSPLLAFMFHT